MVRRADRPIWRSVARGPRNDSLRPFRVVIRLPVRPKGVRTAQNRVGEKIAHRVCRDGTSTARVRDLGSRTAARRVTSKETKTRGGALPSRKRGAYQPNRITTRWSGSFVCRGPLFNSQRLPRRTAAVVPCLRLQSNRARRTIVRARSCPFQPAIAGRVDGVVHTFISSTITVATSAKSIGVARPRRCAARARRPRWTNTAPTRPSKIVQEASRIRTATPRTRGPREYAAGAAS